MINGPDGFTGAVMAVESIADAAVVIHGPGGCRVRHALLSMSAVPREDRRWGEYGEPYYAGYSRVPASYIDGEDYIGGAVQKLEEALEWVRRDGQRLVAVIDSPGASLMADNHMAAIRDLGVSDGVLVIDGGTMSVPMRRTYGRVMGEVMRHLAPEWSVKRPGTVCIIGLTVLDASWEDSLDEFRSYLEDMGLEVLCAPGAGASVDDLILSASAEFAVAICPESCEGISEYYGGIGAKVIIPGEAPVGFDATRSWIEQVAEATGRDPSKALEGLSRAESRVRSRTEGMRYGMMRVKGLAFSASAPGSVLRPLTSWLVDGMSMVPRSLVDEEADGGPGMARLHDADIVFCDGNTALRMESGRRCRVAVSTGGAVIGSDRLVPIPMFGALGAVQIADAVVRASRGR